MLTKRRSVKNYKDEMVSDELIQKVIDAGLCAPSGMNKQTSIILCIKDKEIRDKLELMNAKILGNEGIKPFYNAPVVLVVLYKSDERNGIYDATLTAANMLNAAYALGLGSCWIHRAKEAFEMEEGKEILKKMGVSSEYTGVANIIIGYNDDYMPKQKSISEGRVFTK